MFKHLRRNYFLRWSKVKNSKNRSKIKISTNDENESIGLSHRICMWEVDTIKVDLAGRASEGGRERETEPLCMFEWNVNMNIRVYIEHMTCNRLKFKGFLHLGRKTGNFYHKYMESRMFNNRRKKNEQQKGKSRLQIILFGVFSMCGHWPLHRTFFSFVVSLQLYRFPFNEKPTENITKKN